MSVVKIWILGSNGGNGSFGQRQMCIRDSCWAKRGRRNFDDFRSLVCFLGRSVCSAALYSLLFLVSQLFLNAFAVKVQDVEAPWNVLRT